MRLLDLFCGAGGAAMGYHQAGFTEIVGVDINPQPNYPFTFRCADWMDALHLMRYELGTYFDLIHASPPCQGYTPMTNRHASMHPKLITAVRTELRQLYPATPYVIENVTGAAKSMRDPMMLTGEMFGLTTSRPRYFETGGWFSMSPPPMRRAKDSTAIYGSPDGRWLWKRSDGSRLHAWSSMEEGREALEVPWMQTELEVRESIPPAYTRFIGEQFLAQL
jgi:DNA (cytosine-5)-methyltransferase 1